MKLEHLKYSQPRLDEFYILLYMFGYYHIQKVSHDRMWIELMCTISTYILSFRVKTDVWIENFWIPYDAKDNEGLFD